MSLPSNKRLQGRHSTFERQVSKKQRICINKELYSPTRPLVPVATSPALLPPISPISSPMEEEMDVELISPPRPFRYLNPMPDLCHEIFEGKKTTHNNDAMNPLETMSFLKGSPSFLQQNAISDNDFLYQYFIVSAGTPVCVSGNLPPLRSGELPFKTGLPPLYRFDKGVLIKRANTAADTSFFPQGASGATGRSLFHVN